MKRVGVFGAGTIGKRIVEFLKNEKTIEIVAVCDNDKNRWGEEFCGFNIIAPSELFDRIECDAILVAMRDYKEAYDQCLSNLGNTPVYTKVSDIVAEVAYMDISDGCNAKCTYCVTGNDTRNGVSNKIRVTSYDQFVKIYDHLWSKGLIIKKTELGLFNWGEPFLNKDCIKIFNFLSRNKQKYALSTNGSVFREAIDAKTYEFCERIYFSMPGFSQGSYDRIHGFNFELIKENIKKLYKNMLECGFHGEAVISAHLYKFSLEELEELRKWAKE